ncbi:DUF4439 domain-containing protein [Angustibacter luteus]|uniref:DUF4439 domain-containing protein n=1 Tax=Angustibacter luteus TaxID=658456 RepID=A0ABW1JJ54_9ACTN
MSAAQPTAAVAATGTSTSPGADPTTMPAAQATALAAVLAAEQAAVYAYGVVGAQGAAADRDEALTALQRHAARRDLVAARLSVAQQTPKPAPPAYQLPFAVGTPAQSRKLAVHVETAVADANADLVAASPAAARVEASRWLAESAVAARTWGARAQTFPGMPERAGR